MLAFLVGLLTGIIATLVNLAVENIAGYKLLAVVKYIDNKRFCHISYTYQCYKALWFTPKFKIISARKSKMPLSTIWLDAGT